MKAWVLKRTYNLLTESHPLELTDLQLPFPGDREVLIRVSCCGVCHTELDEIEGRTPPKFPIVPGHQVIGNIENCGKNVTKHNIGDRVGVAWIFSAYGQCKFCISGQENLCESFKGNRPG